MAQRQRDHLKQVHNHRQDQSLGGSNRFLDYRFSSAEHSDIYEAGEKHRWQKVAVEKTEVQNRVLDVSHCHKIPVLEGISRHQSCQKAFWYLQVEEGLASLRSFERNRKNTDPSDTEHNKQLLNSWKQGLERVIDFRFLCRIDIFFGNLPRFFTNGHQKAVCDYFAPGCGLTA